MGCSVVQCDGTAQRLESEVVRLTAIGNQPNTLGVGLVCRCSTASSQP